MVVLQHVEMALGCTAVGRNTLTNFFVQYCSMFYLCLYKVSFSCLSGLEVTVFFLLLALPGNSLRQILNILFLSYVLLLLKLIFDVLSRMCK